MKWTSKEIRYLEDHASEGADAIAEALNRSVESVRHQARAYGLSLRRSWLCPNCGQRTFKPLSSKTGWCSACTKEARAAEIAEEVRDIEREVMRQREADRERQRLYSRKSRAKKKFPKKRP